VGDVLTRFTTPAQSLEDACISYIGPHAPRKSVGVGPLKGCFRSPGAKPSIRTKLTPSYNAMERFGSFWPMR
jgi:hypothetical protein